MKAINMKSAWGLFVLGFTCAALLAAMSGLTHAAWVEYETINGNSGDKFGCSVSLSGDLLLVGKKGQDGFNFQSDAGAANIYERQNDGTWAWVQELSASSQYSYANFGQSVALSGDRALVGAAGYGDAPKGEAYVFERQPNGSWSQMEKLTASDASSDPWKMEGFGEAVSISSNFALVGDGDKNWGGGAAYMFSRAADGSWNETAKLTPGDAGSSDKFGGSVSVWGNRALIGADQKRDNGMSMAGAAYIFEGAGWGEAAKLTPNDHDASDLFGSSVSLNGNRALVGARGDSGNIGAAYIFERDLLGQWHQTTKLSPGDGAAGDFFGGAVSLSGDLAVVSSKDNDGSVYVYARDPDGTWNQEAKVTHPAGQEWFNLGDGTTTAGGASLIVGDQNWNASGRVYEFGPGRTAEVPISATPQTVEVLGGTASPGGISAGFDAVTESGMFSADYQTCALEEISGMVGDDIPGEYEIPGQTAQIWQIDHSALSYTGTYTLTFRISRPDNWYQEPNWDELVVLHKADSGWETLRPTHVDPNLYLLTVETSSLSPFVLASGQAAVVPEPTSLLLLVMGGFTLLLRGRRQLS